jgi:hypothetical protein
VPTAKINVSRYISYRETASIEIDVDQTDIDRHGEAKAVRLAAREYDKENGLDWDTDYDSGDSDASTFEVDDYELEETEEEQKRVTRAERVERVEEAGKDDFNREYELVYACQLVPGMKLELEADPVADPDADDADYENSHVEVKTVHVGATRVNVETDVGNVLFPRLHKVLVPIHDQNDEVSGYLDSIRGLPPPEVSPDVGSIEIECDGAPEAAKDWASLMMQNHPQPGRDDEKSAAQYQDTVLAKALSSSLQSSETGELIGKVMKTLTPKTFDE